MNENIQSFNYIATKEAKALILGSIPGVKSLEEVQYYAHPRNQFWKIMGELLDFDHTLEYHERLAKLSSHNIALWDVIAQCDRSGSLDSAIKNQTIIPNDFNAFFNDHTQIKVILFNGQKAYNEFDKKVYKNLEEKYQKIKRIAMPSTSPANAVKNYEQKLKCWNELLRYI